MAAVERQAVATSKFVYRFGNGGADGDAGLKELLGGKGANLAEMAGLGLPVPPGFTITTEVCTAYYANARRLPQSLNADVEAALAEVGERTGKLFGDAGNPLLVSVRSGAPASMPGMMDTILNLGLNAQTVEGLAAATGDRRFAFDSYRRFIQMYSTVVLGLDHGLFENIIDRHKSVVGRDEDTSLLADDWQAVAAAFLDAVERETAKPFPHDPLAQLWGAIGAVFGSWQNERAVIYRRLHDIPAHWGTAVNVQAMVFGNRGTDSATGVAFTRNPSTGSKEFFGEFLVNAQGEDVVAGIRTPQNITEAARLSAGDKKPSLEQLMPEAFHQLIGITSTLERHYRDMQDIEFTIEQGRLWMLQTRSGKRSVKASVKIAVDLAEEGVLTRDEALLRVDPNLLNQLLLPTIDQKAHRNVLARGLAASPGAACGEIVFTAADAVALKAKGRAVLLVRIETSPEDIAGMDAAVGILTSRGGTTSHAAVVARGMGKPCVSGAGALRIDYEHETLRIGNQQFAKGELITINGSTGEVCQGRVALVPPEMSGEFGTLMTWADAARRLRVRANAETPRDARQAREFGAEGIGLCRSEHMFFDAERILAVREMICAETVGGRRNALAKLLPMQRQDFVELFEIMAGLPVTIRLLDPPLHEFLPHEEAEAAKVAAALGVAVERLKERMAELQEFNPMLGFRGCRLGLVYPEITEMQARAVFEAATAVRVKSGATVIPEIMVPLVGFTREFELAKAIIDRVAGEVASESGQPVAAYQVGTMIELPRAALAGRRHCPAGGVLLVRHQRPDADDARSFARRFGRYHRRLPEQRRPRDKPLRLDRPGRCRRTRQHRRRAWSRGTSRPQARHLRRARRRSPVDWLLRGSRPRLHLLLTVPGACRPPRGGPGVDPQEGCQGQRRHCLTCGGKWVRPLSAECRAVHRP